MAAEAARRGFARFCEAGFPTTHDEDWRFTNVSAIARTPFRLRRSGASPVSRSDLRTVSAGSAAASAGLCQRTVCTGAFCRRKLAGRREVGSLADESPLIPKALEPHLGRYLDSQRDAFPR